MIDLEGTRKKLKKYSQFEENEDNIDKFLNLVDEIVLNKENSLIKDILQYFDENSDYNWAFESAGRSLEHFSTEDYVLGLLNNLNLIMPKAMTFCASLVARILNDEDSREFLQTHINKIDKESLGKVLNYLEKEFKYPKENLEIIRKKLGNEKNS